MEIVIIIDDFVECFLVLEGKFVGIMKELLEFFFIKEVDGSEMVKDMVVFLVSDFDMLIVELKEGMDVVGEVGDEIIGDMLLVIY